jgi:hypothetical protein
MAQFKFARNKLDCPMLSNFLFDAYGCTKTAGVLVLSDSQHTFWWHGLDDSPTTPLLDRLFYFCQGISNRVNIFSSISKLVKLLGVGKLTWRIQRQKRLSIYHQI